MGLSKATLKRIEQMQAEGRVQELPRPQVVQSPRSYQTAKMVKAEAAQRGYEQGHFGRYTAADLLHGPQPRRFVLEYDHRHEDSLNVEHEQKKLKTMACWGTVFPNGHIMLDMGIFFRTQEEFERHFREWGVYHVQFVESDDSQES